MREFDYWRAGISGIKEYLTGSRHDIGDRLDAIVAAYTTYTCFTEAIDLVKRFYPTIDLLENGAVLPKDVIEMEGNRI